MYKRALLVLRVQTDMMTSGFFLVGSLPKERMNQKFSPLVSITFEHLVLEQNIQRAHEIE